MYPYYDMRNLLSFIFRNSHWLLAIVLVAFSFYLVFSQNGYQRSVYLTSANAVTGKVYQTSNELISFFNLKTNNAELQAANARLSAELEAVKVDFANYRLAMDSTQVNAFVRDSGDTYQFEYIPALVANISFSGNKNFITLNKGAREGVKPDMGVISSNGIVGVIFSVSEHFSAVIPVINPKFRVSAKLKNSGNYGSIAWNGKSFDVAQLQELPKHESFNKGDTVVTSFSRIFPKGLIIGYVSQEIASTNDQFNTFDVELATDFKTLQNVLIVKDTYFEELNTLEATMTDE